MGANGTTKALVTEILRCQLLDPYAIKLLPYSQLVRDLAFTEQDVVEVTCDLEEEFDLAVPDDVMRGWRTIRDVIRSIDQLRGVS